MADGVPDGMPDEVAGASPDPVVDPTDAGLLAVLHEGEARGLIGPGQTEAGLAHARVWATALVPPGVPPPGAVLDLGSGGGLPGLVLAACWPGADIVLLDARHRAATFLAEAVEALGWRARVRVVEARAELAGRDPALRGSRDLVVARGFAPPPVTAECAAPFLKVGGRLSVSEPPGGGVERWDPDGCAALGLGAAAELVEADAHFVVLVQEQATPERFPRRPGIPAKRPLW